MRSVSPLGSGTPLAMRLPGAGGMLRRHVPAHVREHRVERGVRARRSRPSEDGLEPRVLHERSECCRWQSAHVDRGKLPQPRCVGYRSEVVDRAHLVEPTTRNRAEARRRELRDVLERAQAQMALARGSARARLNRAAHAPWWPRKTTGLRCSPTRRAPSFRQAAASALRVAAARYGRSVGTVILRSDNPRNPDSVPTSRSRARARRSTAAATL